MSKEKSSLGSAVIGGFLGGAFIGYGISSGIEDIAQFTNQTIEQFPNLKLWASGIGGLTLATVVKAMYQNQDEGELKIEKKKPQEQPKTTTQVQPNFEELADIINTLTTGVNNTGISQVAYAGTANVLVKPFKRLQYAYESNRDGFFAEMFEVFKPFTYEGREINPKETLDAFFENGNTLYTVAIEDITRAANKKITNNTNKEQIKTNKLTQMLDKQISLAEEVALWATYLSKRSGPVGEKMRTTLAQYGISNIDQLPTDIYTLGQNINKAYNKAKGEEILVKDISC